MIGQKYKVKKGDTLWDIAGKYLGKNTDWPKIYEHNNEPQVIAASGQKIINPDQIYIGQTIFIPPRHIPSTQPKSLIKSPVDKVNSATGKKVALPFKGIPFAYKLSDLPSSTVASPVFVAEILLSGTITIQRTDASGLLATSVSKSQLFMSSKRETDMALNKLVSQNEVSWNPRSNEIKFENGITVNSNVPYSPSFTITAGVSSETKLPVIKASANCAPIQGKINDFLYAITDLGIEIEITPRHPSSTAAVPGADKRLANAPLVSNNDWHILKGTLLIVGGGLLVMAILAQDVGTGGAGVADNLVGFSAAATLFHHGVSMFKTVPGQYPVKMGKIQI